jgi:SAM-dependent methyltransferase
MIVANSARPAYGASMADAPAPSPLSLSTTWDLVSEEYAREVVPLFEPFARAALELAQLRSGMHVVDVAAGPGTLSILAARAGARVAALDFSSEMVAHLERRRAAEQRSAIEARVGDGMQLPYSDESFDAAFSMFGLMFFPDRARGFRELRRVLRPGARAVVSSWVDFATVPEMAALFESMNEVLPPRPANAPQGLPLANPDACRSELAAAGFREVTVHEHATRASYPSTAALLDSMIRTSAPVVLMRKNMGEKWPAFEAAWAKRVTERLGAGAQSFDMRAYLSAGTR